MGQLFSYNTICTQLIKDSRTLIVTLNRPEAGNPITLETLFELESIFSWVSAKVEVSSVLINASGPNFSSGIPIDGLKKYKLAKILKVRKKVWELQKAMLSLPQVIVMDLGEGACNLALELSFAADMRLGSEDGQFKMNNLELGIPFLHPSALSKKIIGSSEQKNWFFSTDPINVAKLAKTGFFFQTYNSETRDESIKMLLHNIQAQSPVSRIQTKLALNQETITEVENSIESENRIIEAALTVRDWKNENHIPAKEVKNAVKMTLIRGGASPRGPQTEV